MTNIIENKNTILDVQNIKKSTILNNISFSVKEGEMVAIMGPSGSGKSTLLYNVSGMDQADSGISDLADRKITEVSGGQLQRACICRSMINSQCIIFADEPTGALNKSSSIDVMDAFKAVNETGTTILMVKHDSKVASRCDRILYLVDGQIVGELSLKAEFVSVNDNNDSKNSKEQIVSRWLEKMGW